MVCVGRSTGKSTRVVGVVGEVPANHIVNLSVAILINPIFITCRRRPEVESPVAVDVFRRVDPKVGDEVFVLPVGSPIHRCDDDIGIAFGNRPTVERVHARKRRSLIGHLWIVRRVQHVREPLRLRELNLIRHAQLPCDKLRVKAVWDVCIEDPRQILFPFCNLLVGCRWD